jgi:hypothetical protein
MVARRKARERWEGEGAGSEWIRNMLADVLCPEHQGLKDERLKRERSRVADQRRRANRRT